MVEEKRTISNPSFGLRIRYLVGLSRQRFSVDSMVALVVLLCVNADLVFG